MNTDVIMALNQRLFFRVEDIEALCHIKRASASVLCSRYLEKGLFIRLKRNMYVLSHRWPYLRQEDFFKIANYLQVPSYISCASALSYYGISTQIQPYYIESVAQKRSKRYEVKQTLFNYLLLPKSLYFGFSKRHDIFIADPEKAFLDALYLLCFGKYSLDIHAIDRSRLDGHVLSKLAIHYPSRVQKELKALCKI